MSDNVTMQTEKTPWSVYRRRIYVKNNQSYDVFSILDSEGKRVFYISKEQDAINLVEAVNALAKLQRTKDGVAVYPGMPLYSSAINFDDSIDSLHAKTVASWIEHSGQSIQGNVSDYYSTREAAEAAKEDTQ